MLIITTHVDVPPGQAIGVKEQIAQDLERYGDVRVVSIEEKRPEQMRIGEGGNFGKIQKGHRRRAAGR